MMHGTLTFAPMSTKTLGAPGIGARMAHMICASSPPSHWTPAHAVDVYFISQALNADDKCKYT